MYYPPIKTTRRLPRNVLSKIQAGNPPGIEVSFQIPRSDKDLEDILALSPLLALLTQDNITACGTACNYLVNFNFLANR